ncbi:MAG: outer membrane protein assembly factor BamA [Campylobacterota bacterium]|nr:outer membrane protein assembly factor BamA [Campylobacterota bacterium]
MKKFILLLSSAVSLFSASQFKQIEFKGLTQISTDVAMETLSLENKNSYEIEEINSAIKRFYKFGYFKNIWVNDENGKLIFNFKEKPFVVKIDMRGYKTREDELKLLYTQMNIKKGSMYTPKRVETAKKLLELVLEREGYINSVVEVDVEKISDTNVALTFNVNKGEEILIESISYKGAAALNKADFDHVTANKQEDCCFTWFFGQNDGKMDFEQLRFDSSRIKDLYYQKGYLDASVTAAFSKIDFNTNRSTIEYTIVEGEQYKVNDIVIYLDETILDPNSLYEKLKMKKGDTFDINKVRKDNQLLKVQVANLGYAFAQVSFDVKKNEDKTIDLVYNFIPGDKVYIDDVIISGNLRTIDRVVRRSVYMAPGDLYNEKDYLDSINALRRTGYFSNVNIKKERVSSHKVNLLVSVEEAPTGNLVFGGGYGSYDGFMLNASVKDKNIFGSGIDLSFSFDHSSRKTNYNIAVYNPSLNDGDYSGRFNIYKKESEIDTNINLDEDEKTTFEKGFSLGMGKSISRYTRVGASYNYDNVDIVYTENKELDNHYTISAFTPYINFNNTDDYYLPRKGISASTSLKYAGLGADAKYILSSTSFKTFHSLEDFTGVDAIFRYKLRLKYLKDNGNIPDGTTFYLGGISSVRGFQSYSLQPEDDEHPFKRFATNSIEIGFPLIKSAKMRWGLFYDYGMIGEESFTEEKRAGAGAYIAWQSPMGLVQFIFPKALNPEDSDTTSSFEFNLGGSF